MGKLIILAAGKPAEISTGAMIHNGLSITAWPSGHAQDTEEAIEFAEVHGVNCMIEKFPFDKANEALAHMSSGKVRFRVSLPT
jgi:D-arabinose 1-dehydrogenase-like Zn-dependent alcohol dehydrogenase